jgi:hypothetical protein
MGEAHPAGGVDRPAAALPEWADAVREPSAMGGTPHSLRRTWATFAAMIGRDPKWIAAQIGHVSPAFTFSVYQQVATRRYVDEQAVWTLMRFADEPAERVPTRQITRTAPDDPRRSFQAEKGDFDRALDELNAPGEDE